MHTTWLPGKQWRRSGCRWPAGPRNPPCRRWHARQLLVRRGRTERSERDIIINTETEWRESKRNKQMQNEKKPRIDRTANHTRTLDLQEPLYGPVQLCCRVLAVATPRHRARIEKKRNQESQRNIYNKMIQFPVLVSVNSFAFANSCNLWDWSLQAIAIMQQIKSSTEPTYISLTWKRFTTRAMHVLQLKTDFNAGLITALLVSIL
jgi:hypothetical protein